MGEIATYTINDLFLGMKYEITKQVTLSHIKTFADYTGDNHPLHCDEKYSIKSGFKNIIAHGMMVSSLSSQIIGMHLPGKNSLVLSQSFKYIKPIYPQDELKIEGVVKSIDKRFSIVLIAIKVKKEDGEVASTGEYSVKIRK